MSKKRLHKKNFSGKILLFALGIFLIIFSLTWSAYEKTRYSFSEPYVQPASPKASLPVVITIPKIHLSFSVYETGIRNGVWAINENGVSHLNSSARPTQKGSIILYAHNTVNRFGRLRELAMSDLIEIETVNGKKYTYIVTAKTEVAPTDIEVLKSDTETLILYTCTGFFDSKRLVVKAVPK